MFIGFKCSHGCFANNLRYSPYMLFNGATEDLCCTKPNGAEPVLMTGIFNPIDLEEILS